MESKITHFPQLKTSIKIHKYVHLPKFDSPLAIPDVCHVLTQFMIMQYSGGSRGVPPVRTPPKGPDSFILTYKFFETEPPWDLVPPYEVGAPPMGNPRSTAAIVVAKLSFDLVKL